MIYRCRSCHQQCVLPLHMIIQENSGGDIMSPKDTQCSHATGVKAMQVLVTVNLIYIKCHHMTIFGLSQGVMSGKMFMWVDLNTTFHIQHMLITGTRKHLTIGETLTFLKGGIIIKYWFWNILRFIVTLFLEWIFCANVAHQKEMQQD